MKRKQLGRSDMEITSLGLGTWAIGGAGYAFGWGPQDDDASIAAMHRALELGIRSKLEIVHVPSSPSLADGPTRGRPSLPLTSITAD